MTTLCLYLITVFQFCIPLEDGGVLEYRPGNVSVTMNGVTYFADLRYPELTRFEFADKIFYMAWAPDVIFRHGFN